MRSLLLCFLVLAAAISAAKPPFLKVFMATYNIDPNSVIGKARCLNCHENPGPPNRNAYGKLVRQALIANDLRMVTPEILKSIEGKDMGEGLTFLQKIQRDLPPGQPIPEPVIEPLPLLPPSAGPVPREWTMRYRSLSEMYRTRDLSSLRRVVTDDYVWLPTQGKAMKKREAFEEMGQMFKARRISGQETIRSYARKDDEVQIEFDLRLKITDSLGKTFRYREVGTDFWRKADGDWKIYRTQDKLVQQSEPK